MLFSKETTNTSVHGIYTKIFSICRDDNLTWFSKLCKAEVPQKWNYAKRSFWTHQVKSRWWNSGRGLDLSTTTNNNNSNNTWEVGIATIHYKPQISRKKKWRVSGWKHPICHPLPLKVSKWLVGVDESLPFWGQKDFFFQGQNVRQSGSVRV